MANPALLHILGGIPKGPGLIELPAEDFSGPLLETLAPETLMCQPVRNFIPSAFHANFDSLVELLSYGSDDLGPFEMELIRPDGRQLKVQVSLGREVIHSREFTMMMVQDITEWVETRADLDMIHFELEQSYSITIESWALALELRHLESKNHSKRVVPATLDLAERAGISPDEMKNIRHGALLHDIGKLSVPDEILKKPGKLTPEEWGVMKLHPDYARQLIDRIPYLKPAITIPYMHHEKWDGSGYPLGLSGDQIPLAARIFAVVDVIEALLDNRSYRGYAWSEDQVYDYIRENQGKHFDPDVARLTMDNFGQVVTILKPREA